MDLRIELADFTSEDLVAFLQGHLDELAPTAPPESRHALDLDGLRRPDVRLWVARDGGTIVGTGALAALELGHEELKSMRTDPRCRGRGVGSRMLDHLLSDARGRGVRRISLETGSMPFFASARSMYARAGFASCPPFGTYTSDPNSVFLSRDL